MSAFIEFHNIYQGDTDFFSEQLSKISESLYRELPSEFVERVRYLTPELTPFPGKFSFERFPYFRKIVDCFSPLDMTEEIVLMKGNQMGATTAVLENIVLYNIMSDPKSQMTVTADAGLMKTSVKVRIETMINNAGARDLIFSQARKKRGSQNTGDTSNEKEYPGGYLHFFGSRSPARFRGMSYRTALADEVDAFPDSIPKEGTVVDLVRNRTNAYTGNKRKIFWVSTPLVKQTSKIEPLYNMGTQEKFFVPCKHCGTMQELVWHGENKETGYTWGIVWENDEQFKPKLATVAYKCGNPECGGLMKNYDKSVIIQRGEWRETANPTDPSIKSFHITPIYNPPGMFTWEDMVRQWAGCWDLEKNRMKDKEKYRLFRNTKQGLSFEDSGVQVDYERAIQYRRTGFIAGKVPNDIALQDTGSSILVVVASVDVQNDRLYVDVKGYADGGSTWTLDFFDIKGNTADFNGPWDELDTFIDGKRYIGNDGKVYRILITLIDSGHNSEWVYAFAQRHSSGVYACKGRDRLGAGETYQLFSPSALQRIGMEQVYHINTGKLKDKISVALMSSFWQSNEHQPHWYPNFPEDFKDDYFKMFEAETKVEKRDKETRKFKGYVWQLDFGKPNHAFDTYVYNLAALEIFAEDVCKTIGLAALNWDVFWEWAKAGNFYNVPHLPSTEVSVLKT
jgi:phage terminase large subunit GpA-like protein